MGVIIPQVVSEDRAGGAQIIDGGLRFVSGNSQYLTRTPGSAGNRTTWTWSGWVKRNSFGTYQYLFCAGTNESTDQSALRFNDNETIDFFYFTGSFNWRLNTSQVFRDTSSWVHICAICDTNNATANDRQRLYINGVQVTAFAARTNASSGSQSVLNLNTLHGIGGPTFTGASNYYSNAQLSNIYFIDGQALDASYFGFTDPLTNTWRPKKLSSSVAFGTNGFYLPFDGSAPIGQDQSGRGNNWTPVNFGGSTALDKATGALPILNTDGGGKVARVGVRTDSNASSLVLALPLVGIKSDFSNAINSGTSNKAVTVTNAVASSAQSNFYGGSWYFDGTGDYISVGAYNTPGFLLGNQKFTIEAWVYRSATGASHHIVGKGNDNGYWVFVNSSNKLSWYQVNNSSSGYQTIIDTVDFPQNQWVHVAAVSDGSIVTLYKNGVSIGTCSVTDHDGNGQGPTNSTVALGIGDYYGGANTNTWNGYIQDVRIYKGVAKYTSNFIPASTDPDIVPDSPSGVSYSSNVALVPSTDSGAVGFNGSSQYLSIPDSADWAFGSGDFTIETFAYLNPSNYLYFGQGDGGTPAFVVYGNAVYIGPGIWTAQLNFTTPPTNKWFHWALVRSGNTLTVYVDGVNSGSLSSATSWPDATDAFTIGEARGQYTNGFYSNFHVVKGTALYTANFTPPTAPISSVANTKLLCCKSNSSATTADVTPGTITANGNAAASNFNPFTANIKTVRGLQSGYATWNPLNKGSDITLSNGNLDCSSSSTLGWSSVLATIGVSTGKWYWEFLAGSGTLRIGLGLATQLHNVNTWLGGDAYGWEYYNNNGYLYTNNNAGTTYGATWTNGDIIGVAFDADTGVITFYKNGISQGTAFTGLTSGPYFPAVADSGNAGILSGTINFGQKPFKFPPPAGFQPLTLANTPRPTIVRPDQYVGIVTYTGNGGTQSLNVGFQPDLVWIKSRSAAQDNNLFDSVQIGRAHV